MRRSPEAVDVFLDELEPECAAGVRDALDAVDESTARRLVERLALALQASLLVRARDPAVADAFCATRLAGDWGRAYGTLPGSLDVKTILDRAVA